MQETLRRTFAPLVLEVVDESYRHVGHAGARPEGETHYRLRMVASVFAGLSRVERQRLIYRALDEEFDTGLHALSLDLKTDTEADAS